MTSENVTVGRWLPNDPDGWWECDGSAPARCVRLHGPSIAACAACGAVRPETPAPTQRAQDMADYRETQAMSARTTKATLAALRAAPTLPTPSPRFLTDAQVLGKEPIAGVDDAPLSDGSDVVQEAVNALWRAGYKFLSRDLEAKCAALRDAPVVETGVSDGRFDVLTADEGNLWAWAVENAGIENAATFIREATVKALRAPRPVAASTAEVVLSDRRVVEWSEWETPHPCRTIDIVTNKGRAGCESRRCFKSLDEMRAYPLPYADWQLIDAAFASRATPDGAPSDG